MTFDAGGAINLHGNPPDVKGLQKAATIAAVNDVAVLFVGGRGG